jgi:curved DNA-binding protein
LRAQIRISLEDSYHGATRTVSLNVPEYEKQGRVTLKPRRLNVRIPKGVMRGQQIRLAGEGGPGAGEGAQPGDLYLEIEFEPHPFFRAETRDICLDLPVAPWEAALGTQVTVPTLGGSVQMKIPPNSQSGRKLRLKGRGLPGNPPGDQFAVLKIVTPPAESEAAKQAYRRLAETVPFNPRAQLGVRR